MDSHEHKLHPKFLKIQPLDLSSSSLYLGSLMVVGEMTTTVIAVILNLLVVLALRRAQDGASENYNFLLQNMVHNNLFICVLVKSFEVVFTGMAAITNQTR